MQALRGKLFFQLSSATLVLVATALYQGGRTAPSPSAQDLQAQRAIYERYESALRLLESNHPLSAVELMASFPEKKVSISNSLLKERSLPSSPGILFLRLGMQLTRHAAQATQSGSLQQAQLLRDACANLKHKLERGGDDEKPTDRLQRMHVIRLLERSIQSQSPEVTVGLAHTS